MTRGGLKQYNASPSHVGSVLESLVLIPIHSGLSPQLTLDLVTSLVRLALLSRTGCAFRSWHCSRIFCKVKSSLPPIAVPMETPTISVTGHVSSAVAKRIGAFTVARSCLPDPRGTSGALIPGTSQLVSLCCRVHPRGERRPVARVSLLHQGVPEAQ